MRKGGEDAGGAGCRSRGTAPIQRLMRPDSLSNLPRRWGMVTLACTTFLLTMTCIGSARAGAQALLPPAGQVFQGVAGQPISDYEQASGRHPAVCQIFSAWGEYLPGIFADAANARARLMIHITTRWGNQEMITPQGIADGDGDAWLIAINNAIAAGGHPVYVRLMAEMDNAANAYSAYNADGSSRGAAHSPAQYKRAWKRVTLIMRGGSLAHIDAALARLGMPPLRTASDLPVTQAAMLWVPMTGGSPDIRGNQPADYWPGRAWVDWVGTDFYSKFPNFTGLDRFYAAYRTLPFVFGEYAMWGADNPAFVARFFRWTRSHPRVRMLIYNQWEPTSPFRLAAHPASAAALRTQLSGPRYPDYAPDWSGAAG